MKYRLVQSESADWYIIPIEKTEEWNNWDFEENDYSMPDWADYVELGDLVIGQYTTNYDCVLNAAIQEASTYAGIGGLNDTILEDIAHDHGVSVESLKKGLGWE